MPTTAPTLAPVSQAAPTVIESYKVTPATEIMTIPDDPSGCETTEVPTFRYAASSGKVGKGRLCE